MRTDPAPAWELVAEGDDGVAVHAVVARLPWRIGRDVDNDQVVSIGGVSRHHAELWMDSGGRLRLLDRDSRNGSFVNGLRVIGSSAPLVGGERLHLGAAAFVLRPLARADDATLPPAVPVLTPRRRPSHAAALQALIEGRGLEAAWQPLCATDGGRAWGGELLGRARHPQLPEEPLALLELASQMRCEAALSQAWRALGLERLAASGWAAAAGDSGGRPPVFLNLHPREPLDENLLDALQAQADALPTCQLVVELQPGRLHDDDLPAFVQLLEVAGLAWGLEHVNRLTPEASAMVAELRPSYLKLAPRLVGRLRPGDAGHLRLLVKWQTLAEALGARLVAVGVERRETFELCRSAGLRWVQGFLSGAPRQLPGAGSGN